MTKFIYFWLLAIVGSWHLSAQTYCTPAFANGCANGHVINSFTIEKSGFTDNNTGCSPNSYDDKTTTIIELQKTVTYNYAVNHNFFDYEEYVKIWIDFNKDGVFTDEAPELLSSTTPSGVPASFGTIKIPEDIALGNYRLRIADRWGKAPIPCNVDGNGEAHDYTVKVVAPIICNTPTSVTASKITPTTATFSWTAPATAPANGYEYFYSRYNDLPSQSTPLNTTTSTTVTIPSLEVATNYYFWVRSKCDTNTTSDWSPVKKIQTTIYNDDCSGAITLTPGKTFDENVVTAINTIATTDTIVTSSCVRKGYNDIWFKVKVPASGKITIETAPVDGDYVTDTMIQIFTGTCDNLGSTYFCNDNADSNNLFSKINYDGEPDSTVYIAVWILDSGKGKFKISAYNATLGTSDVNSSLNEVTIYPNPFKDVLKISDIENIKSVSVLDLSGALIKTLKPASELQLGDLKAGVYLINLDYLDGTTKTIKAVKK